MQHLPATAWALWAKKSKPGEGGWLPLPQHLKDAADIAGMLWDQWLSEGVRKQICRRWGDEDEVRQLLIFLAAVHDIGKTTPVFQAKAKAFVADDLDEQLLEGLQATGLPCEGIASLRGKKGVHHSLMGYHLLVQFGVPDKVAIIVAAHHGRPPGSTEISNSSRSGNPDHYHLEHKGQQAWQSLQQQIFTGALRLAGYNNAENLPQPTQNAQLLLAALVIMADWIASNEKLFSYIKDIQADDSSFEGDRAQAAWKNLGLTTGFSKNDGWHQPPVSDYFTARFSIKTPYPAQLAVQQIAKNLAFPGIMIIEAPMGQGRLPSFQKLILSCLEIQAHQKEENTTHYGKDERGLILMNYLDL